VGNQGTVPTSHHSRVVGQVVHGPIKSEREQTVNERWLSMIVETRIVDIHREVARERLAQEARLATNHTPWRPLRFSLRWLRGRRASTVEYPKQPVMASGQ
jgi:hypothetical protein